MVGLLAGLLDCWMVGWMVGLLDGWMDCWMDGLLDGYRAILLNGSIAVWKDDDKRTVETKILEITR